jgi:hypothetical protein
VEPGQGGLVEPFAAEALQPAGVGLATAQGPHIEGGALQGGDHRRIIQLGIVGEDGHGGVGGDQVGEHLVRPGVDYPIHMGEALRGGEGPTGIDQVDPPAQDLGDGGQGDADVGAPYDEEEGRGHIGLNVDLDLALGGGQADGSGVAEGQIAPRDLLNPGVQLRMPGRQAVPGGLHDPFGAQPGLRTPDHCGHRDGLLPADRLPHPLEPVHGLAPFAFTGGAR